MDLLQGITVLWDFDISLQEDNQKYVFIFLILWIKKLPESVKLWKKWSQRVIK